MAANLSRVWTTVILVGVLVVIAIILNAATLGVVIKRFDDLKDNSGNQIPSTNQTTFNSNLVEATRIDDVMKHLSEFYRIAIAENNTRAANTRGFNRTLDYIIDYLSVNTSFQITTTDFLVRTFQLASDPILIISINGTITNRTYSIDLSKAEFFYVEYSAPINLSSFVALTAIPNTGCSDDDWRNANPSPAVDRIALVQRGSCDFSQKVALALKYNATSILIYNTPAAPYPANPIVISLDQNNELPALFLSYNLGQELVTAIANPAANISARIVIDLVDIPLFLSTNICADTPTGDVTQTVVVGSHSDSVPAGPGINDNGSGSAANLALAVALARLFQTSNYTKYKYRIRFCWWGAEEIGLIGSDFYIKQARNSTVPRERISDNLVNLNFDMLASPNYVFGIYDGQTITDVTPARAIPGSKKVTSLFRDWFNSQKLPCNNSTLGSGSDYAPFLAAGIAAGGLLSGASGIKTKEQCDRYALMLGSDPYCIPTLPYDPCYHQSCDTIWNINVFAYEKMVQAGAYVIESLARVDNLKEWLYPARELATIKSPYKNHQQYNSINEYFNRHYA